MNSNKKVDQSSVVSIRWHQWLTEMAIFVLQVLHNYKTLKDTFLLISDKCWYLFQWVHLLVLLALQFWISDHFGVDKMLEALESQPHANSGSII